MNGKIGTERKGNELRATPATLVTPNLWLGATQYLVISALSISVFLVPMIKAAMCTQFSFSEACVYYTKERRDVRPTDSKSYNSVTSTPTAHSTTWSIPPPTPTTKSSRAPTTISPTPSISPIVTLLPATQTLTIPTRG
jgi:hypothetical protein